MRINNPLNENRKVKVPTEDDLISIHHDMMCVYGWIPINEFRELPIGLLIELNKRVQEEKCKKERFMLIVAKGLGYKKNRL